jgi:hypothetical protein
MTQPYLLTAVTEVERLRIQSRTLEPVAEALLEARRHDAHLRRTVE